MELLSNSMDMTNVCTLCGESEKNESISGEQWVMSMHIQNNYICMCVYMQVQCDKCDCWQHVDCIETARQQIEYKDKSFFCLTCVDDAPSFIYQLKIIINFDSQA